QAFTLGRRLPRYTPFEIREQIRAAEDLGITSLALWNPRSVYQRGSLRPKHGSTSPETQTVSSVRGGRYRSSRGGRLGKFHTGLPPGGGARAGRCGDG